MGSLLVVVRSYIKIHSLLPLIPPPYLVVIDTVFHFGRVLGTERRQAGNTVRYEKGEYCREKE